MLVLSRKAGETILIGDDVEITISRIAYTSVRICIKAPKEILVLRGELLESSPSPQNREAPE